MTEPTTPSWLSHLDVVQVIIAGLIAYMVYTLKELVTWFKLSIADLYTKYNNLNDQFNRLLGEHEAIDHTSYRVGPGRRKTDKNE